MYSAVDVDSFTFLGRRRPLESAVCYKTKPLCAAPKTGFNQFCCCFFFSNFPTGSQMDENFSNMRSLIQVLDQSLYETIQQNGDFSHFYFCYRFVAQKNIIFIGGIDSGSAVRSVHSSQYSMK